jgi:predicted AAA+ superfamily ATPase
MIPRIYDNLEEQITPWKVTILYWPRRSWKTTILKQFLNRQVGKWRFEIGENKTIHHLFLDQDLKKMTERVDWYDGIIIDEAQEIPNIWVWLKMLIDTHPNLSIIVSWSSSFELGQYVWEPLVWRKKTITLFPISVYELMQTQYNTYDVRLQFENMLIYGMYPSIFTTTNISQKQSSLSDFVDSLLLKDILHIERIKWSRVLYQLLQLLAWQIGNEVSIHELAQKVGMDQKTIEKYLDILEKWFIIYSVSARSWNLRNVISKKQKWYFRDLWIRNALIQQRHPLNLRNDVWVLRENFVVMEKRKANTYQDKNVMQYFRRTYAWQEIDLIESFWWSLLLYECKWSEKKTAKLPTEWKKQDPDAVLNTITPQNIFEFIR